MPRHPLRRLLLASLLALCASAGAPPARAADAPSPAAVRKAIDAAVAWLESGARDLWRDETFHDTPEVAVLALAHSGANLHDAAFAKGVKLLEKVEPRWTYRTSLLAMALAEVNPRLYQAKIAHCAQWLVDTQLPEGEWGYPGTVEGGMRKTHPEKVAPPPPPAAPEGGAGGDAAGKPAAPASPQGKIVIQRRGSPTGSGVMRGDFSNTQLAILGLRACGEAGVEVPQETWKAAQGYLKKCQRKDGGWGYVIAGEPDESSYASLTCAGVCSAALCAHALGAKDFKSDPMVLRGLAWLDKNLDVSQNVNVDASSVRGESPWQYYHLYALERAARVLGLEKVAGIKWYDEGAAWLLKSQEASGRWADAESGSNSRKDYLDVADTCFALLFLTRATRPVTSGK